MLSNRFLASAVKRQLYGQSRVISSHTTRCFSFVFAGPRDLNSILKKELIEHKTPAEVADLWYSYHESKDNVLGLTLKGSDAKNLLSRAASSPFFVQPIFREDGYFLLLSQYQEPGHFLMAYLEDYQMDPSSAQPLITFSVFDDYANEKDLALVRADVVNKGIEDQEAYKVVQNMLDGYVRDEEYIQVYGFNKKPDTFAFDDFIAQQNEKWKKPKETTEAVGKTVEKEEK